MPGGWEGVGRTLKDFEGSLVGMKAGETKTFDVAFPADYFAKELAGKTATFEATVKSVHEAVLPEVDEAMAQSLGLRVVAEGVETAEQVATLRGFGCEYIQGYYFGKPMDAESLIASLTSSSRITAFFSAPFVISYPSHLFRLL